ncbi:hypothetical protein NCGM2209_1624 [Mycobacterium tuberculosis NCGM2209]|nr:hypothetical protein NCGM2209_1624 [Mycobacterium tuberculosis NCGM2209]
MGPYTRPTTAHNTMMTGSGGRNAMTIDAKPRVRTAVDMVTRRGTRIANTAYPSAPTRPPPAIAINAQPSCTGCWWSVKYFGNSTLSIGRYSAVTVRSIIPRVRNTRRFQTKRSPSAIPDTNPWGREVWCGLPAPCELQGGNREDGQPECRRGNPHCGDAANRRDHQATDGRADNKGQVEDRLVGAVDAVQRPACPSGGLGQHRVTSRHACRAEGGRQGGQYGQHQHVDRVAAVPPRHQGDAGHRRTRQRIGHHRHPATPEVVDRGAGDQRGEQQRQHGRTGHDRGLPSAALALQHQPRKRDYRDAITRGRHQRCEQDQECRAAVAVSHEYRG